MRSPGRSRASSRSSSSGSPKCMNRPPLQVPTAVWLSSGTRRTLALRLVRLALVGCAGRLGVLVALGPLVGLFLFDVVVAVLAGVVAMGLHGGALPADV